jgi:hypothetical protein
MRVVMPPDFTHPRAARLAAWMLIGMVAVQVRAGRRRRWRAPSPWGGGLGGRAGATGLG